LVLFFGFSLIYQDSFEIKIDTGSKNRVTLSLSIYFQ